MANSLWPNCLQATADFLRTRVVSTASFGSFYALISVSKFLDTSKFLDVLWKAKKSFMQGCE
jgi:hypothetical protein